MADILSDLLNFFNVNVDTIVSGGVVEQLLAIAEIPFRFISGISLLTSFNFFNGIITFIFTLISYLPLIFIILQGTIIVASIMGAKDENGRLSPFALISNFIEGQIYWITSVFKILYFGVDMIHKIINSVVPI